MKLRQKVSTALMVIGVAMFILGGLMEAWPSIVRIPEGLKFMFSAWWSFLMDPTISLSCKMMVNSLPCFFTGMFLSINLEEDRP